MFKMTLAEVTDAVGGEIVRGARSTVISAVSTDSRSVSSGDLFVPLVGEQFDGHDYVEAAVAGGAAVVLASKARVDDAVAHAPAVIQVDDTLRALGALASATRQRVGGTVVGITGSNGKTSTKELTAAVLGPSAHKAPASYNNAVGVALTLLGVTGASDPVVLEMGTNHFGEIAGLVEMAAPDIGVFLNAAEVHTEFLEDADGVAREKSALPLGSAHAVLNADDPRVMRYAADCEEATSFGIGEGSHVCATRVELDEYGRASFNLEIAGEDVGRVALRLLGRHHVHNALAAAAVGHVVGVVRPDIVARLCSAEGPSMRMQLEDIAGVSVINDAYNANPASVAVAFETFREMRVQGARWILLGDMLELGGDVEAKHRAVVGDLSPDWCDGFVPCGVHADAMAAAAKEAGIRGILRGDTGGDIADALVSLLVAGDALLVKGSRGAQLETVVDAYRASTRDADGGVT